MAVCAYEYCLYELELKSIFVNDTVYFTWILGPELSADPNRGCREATSSSFLQSPSGRVDSLLRKPLL